MAYDTADPRSAMQSRASAPGSCRDAQYFELAGIEPDDTSPGGSRTWWVRSQAVVVAYTEAVAGDTLPVDSSDEEHVVLLLDADQSLDVRHGDDIVRVSEPSLVVVPPGTSSVTATGDGVFVRIFAANSPDLTARCRNASEYVDGDARVAEFEQWPTPPAGFTIRVYPFSDAPDTEGIFGRIFRCTTLMVNVLFPVDGERDPCKLSPHSHDDFEQISLHVAGDYVHHMRTPWIPDSTTWRDDDHHHCVSPAIVAIPPGLIHTSQPVGEMHHWLIDIFGPPRADFSLQPGWVRNDSDYPIPERLQVTAP